MSVRRGTRTRCRTRKVKVIAMTRAEWDLVKKLDIDFQNYCKQPSVKKRVRARYKFG